MLSLDNRWVLSYNGEIYNYRELRANLEAEGIRFHSQTDTEVVLNALVHWGPDALLRFNGMFALGLWDRHRQRLLIARDRYGIKPLYYSQQGQLFAFASEQKALIANYNFRRKLNRQALFEYCTFQNIFTDQTLLEDICLLPPGHYATLDLGSFGSQGLNRYQYWDYQFREHTGTLSREVAIEELDRLFQQAVQRQLVADVELGSYLSGGMDSASITAIAVRQYPYLKTFTCGFDLSSASGIELAFDERNKAEAMSAFFKTEHYEMVLKAGDLERCLPSLSWHLEEPRVGQSYPNFYAAKLASKFVKVVLSGSGGDELFAGYPWRYYRAINCQDFDGYVNSYYHYWQRLLDAEELRNLFAPIWPSVSDVSTLDIFRDVFLDHDNQLETPQDYINHSLYFEAKTFLHGLFIVEDKLSMAHGLEARVPFMDNDLVEFAMRLPVEFKLNNLQHALRLNENEAGSKPEAYFQKTSDGKQVLRDAMRRYVPDVVTSAVKQGFSAPDASWFKGESIDYVRRTLYDRSSPLYEIVDYAMACSLIDQHLNGSRNRRLLIWSFLNLDAWMKTIHF